MPEDEGEDEAEPIKRSPRGAEYQTLASSLGLPCPPELVLLGDALAGGRVFGGLWELETPESAVHTRKELLELAIDSPCLQPRAQMLPLFFRDGDSLLLDRDGSIWPWSHEIPTDDEGCVARSLDEALGMMLDEPEIEFQRGDRGGFWSVDGIYYQYTVGHSCETGASSKESRCATGVSIDLAPHVIRPPGDHHLRFSFPEPPPERPRTAPIGLVTTPRGVVDLRRLEVLTALLRIGRARGWTGRAGPLTMDDATPLLDEIP